MKKIFSLSFGTAVYQVIAFFSYPIFALNYDIEVFAQFGQYSALLSVISVWSVGRFNQAILVDKSESDIIYSLIIGLILLILAAFTVTLYLTSFFTFSNLYFIPVSILAFGLFELASSTCIVKEKYRYVSVIFLTYGCLTLLLQYGFIGVFPYGLVIGKIIGDLILGIISVVMIVKYFISYKYYIKIDKNRLLRHFSLRKDYLVYGCPQGFLSSFARNLPMIVLPGYSTEVAGYFSLFYKLIAVPVDFLSKPIRQIVLNKKVSQRLLIKYYSTSFYIYPLMFVALFVMFYFDTISRIWLTSLIKDFDWVDYINIAFSLSIVLVQVLLSTPIKTLMINAGLQRKFLGIEFITCCVKVMFIYCALHFFDTYDGITIYILFVALIDNATIFFIKNNLAKKVFNE
ncbi:hypothetical protein AB4152_07530 [Vibrio breoganii]